MEAKSSACQHSNYDFMNTSFKTLKTLASSCKLQTCRNAHHNLATLLSLLEAGKGRSRHRTRAATDANYGSYGQYGGATGSMGELRAPPLRGTGVLPVL